MFIATSCLYTPPYNQQHTLLSMSHDKRRVEECVKTAGGGVIWTEMIDKDIPAEAVNSAVHLTDLYKVGDFTHHCHLFHTVSFAAH